MNIWKNCPVDWDVELTHYPAKEKKTTATVLILPGGGYAMHAEYEGAGYAEFLNELGMDAFVLIYRVQPNRFPLPLNDARRAVRYLRYNSEKFGIDPNRIAIMGSSAGGHLSALLSTYRQKVANEEFDAIDEENYLPNAQILCYPVINMTDETIRHNGSMKNLLGDEQLHLQPEVSPDLIADEKTPPAFIWHTAADGAVSVINSYRYATRLREVGVSVEMHIFPEGNHGLGIPREKNPYVTRWADMLAEWLQFIGFFA